MKQIPTSIGPFSRRPYFTAHEIEELCSQELLALDLFPSQPEPVRIDRFLEKRFDVVPQYEDLGSGILGMTQFGLQGVMGIYISRSLAEEGTDIANRQIRTTLAHEGGHGLLHASMFASDNQQNLFNDLSYPMMPQVLCRSNTMISRANEYTGEWWEFQANRAIGGLLMPRDLVIMSLQPYLILDGSLGTLSLNRFSYGEATRLLVELFDVNPAVSRIRLETLFPSVDSMQLCL